MSKDKAARLLEVALDCTRKVEESLGRVGAECDAGTFDAYREHADQVAGYIFTNIIGPIYECYPDLAPEWYSGSGDSSIGMSAELKAALVKELESVYSALDSVQQEVGDIPGEPGIRPLDTRLAEVLDLIDVTKRHVLERQTG